MEGFFVLVGIILLIGGLTLPILMVVIYLRLGDIRSEIERMDLRLDRLQNDLQKEPKPGGHREKTEPESVPRPVPVTASVPATPPPLPPPVPPPSPAAPKTITCISIPPTYPSSAAEKKPAADFVPPAEPVPSPFVEPEPSAFEKRFQELAQRAWNWLVVGEEFRQPGVAVEKAIASTWLLRSGIIVFLFCVGYFLDYSIKNGILSREARTALAYLAGVGLLAFGLKQLGRRYHVIGQGFCGAGIGTLYFSVFATSMMYKFVEPFPGGLLLMSLVTVTAGVLAVRSDSLFIAIIGVGGGLLTPFFLHNTIEPVAWFYGYFLMLNLGVLYVAARRQWPLLNLLALIGTYAVYFGQLPQEPQSTRLFFLCAYAAVFASLPLISSLILRRQSSGIDLTILFINAAIAFGEGTRLITSINQGDHTPAALMPLGLCALYVFHIVLLVRRAQQDRPLLIGLLALGSFMLAAVPPLVFSKDWWTASWALLALVLMWAAIKLNSRILRTASYLIYGLVALTLVMVNFPEFLSRNFVGLEMKEYLRIMLERLFTIGVPIASLAGAWKLSALHPEPVADLGKTENLGDGEAVDAVVGGVFIWGAVLALAAALTFETYVFCHLFWTPVAWMSVTAVWLIVALALLLDPPGGKRLHPGLIFWPLLVFLVVKFCIGDWQDWNFSPDTFAYADWSGGEALVRLVDFGIIIAFLAWIWHFVQPDGGGSRFIRQTAGAGALLLLFCWSTLETSSFLRYWHDQQQLKTNLQPIGITMLWAIFALSFVGTGLVKRIRPLRYTGLALFVVVIAKLFLFDLHSLVGDNSLYRVISLLVVAVLLICGSAVYIKFERNAEDQKENDA
jgi:uncharacterized membrane protein